MMNIYFHEEGKLRPADSAARQAVRGVVRCAGVGAGRDGHAGRRRAFCPSGRLGRGVSANEILEKLI